MYYLYVVEDCFGSFYCGITTDVSRRIEEHNGSPKGAKCLRGRRPVFLRTTRQYPDRSSALKAEYAFKQLTRKDKELRIAEWMEYNYGYAETSPPGIRPILPEEE